MSGLAIALLLAGAVELRPVIDRPYRYDTVETRGDGTASRRFATHRTLVFQRDASGALIAEVTLDSIERPDDPAGTMFAAAQAGLLHRPIRFHLDPAGKVAGVDDADAVWAALVDGMTAMAANGQTPTGDRQAGAQTMTAALRTLPPERRLAMLASSLTLLLAPSAAGRADGTRPVSLPARPPAPPGTSLAGTEIVSHGKNGTVTIRIETAGDIVAAGPTPSGVAPSGNGRMTSSSIRNIDPTSGLIEDSRDTRDLTISGAGGVKHTVSETVITLALTP